MLDDKIDKGSKLHNRIKVIYLKYGTKSWMKKKNSGTKSVFKTFSKVLILYISLTV